MVSHEMLRPLPKDKWDYRCAAHLLNRAGFGGSPEEVESLRAMGMEKAVAHLVDGQEVPDSFPKPAEVAVLDWREIREKMKGLSEPERLEQRRKMMRDQNKQRVELIGWWLERMRKSPWPFREKMTLFWHGHFATGFPKVREAQLLWQQNETFRQNALGNFVVLTKAVSRDPAMMLYLDSVQSTAGKPNENFARELMELFTLGIGNYEEEDIREAARAFTGYRIDRANGSFRFVQQQHDSGQKRFFGRTGKFEGDDIIEMIVAKPACGSFIANKLWEFFAYEDPEDQLVEALGQQLRSGKYELRPFMKTLLSSEEFYSGRAVRTQIKSPVQLLVQDARMLESGLAPARLLMNTLRQLGQIPFEPPSVKGWDGGKAWITTATLLGRYNLSNVVLGRERSMQRSGQGGFEGPGVNLQKILPPEKRGTSQTAIGALALRLFQGRLDARQQAPLEEFLGNHGAPYSDPVVRELLHLMMSTPQFQLT